MYSIRICALLTQYAAGTINKALSIPVLSDSSTQDLYRGIRQQLASLLGGVDQKDLNTMSLGLGHSLSHIPTANASRRTTAPLIRRILPRSQAINPLSGPTVYRPSNCTRFL